MIKNGGCALSGKRIQKCAATDSRERLAKVVAFSLSASDHGRVVRPIFNLRYGAW